MMIIIMIIIIIIIIAANIWGVRTTGPVLFLVCGAHVVYTSTATLWGACC